ncbi:MAG TPA: choice-of-anchor D domain-containing protein [Terriglobales bacterium]
MPLPGTTYDASLVMLGKQVVGDGAGNFYVGGPHEILKITADGKLTVLAGTGVATNNTGGGAALSTRLAVDSLAGDPAGNLYAVDTVTGVVRKVDVSTGAVSVVAGTPGVHGTTGDGGLATAADLDSPVSVTVGATGAIYIGDGVDCSIREVNPGDGTIQTLLGGCRAGGLQYPAALTADGKGNLYIADVQAGVVWRRDGGTGALTVFAGQLAGTGQGTALPGYPDALAMDAVGDLFIGTGGEIDKVAAGSSSFTTLAKVSEEGIWSDATGNVWAAGPVLHRVDGATGAVSVVAGSSQAYLGDGSSPLSAQLNGRGGMAIDATGDIFLGGNPIVEVTAAGQVHAVAGGGTAQPSAGPIAANTVDLSQARGIALDTAGSLYVTVNTASSSHVYKLDPSTAMVSNVAGGWPGSTPAADGVAATGALLQGVGSVAVDGSGNIDFVLTQSDEVWEVVKADGTLRRVAGNGPYARSGDGGPATSATIPNLGAIASSAAGDLYLADGVVVRRVDHATGIIATVIGNGQSGSTGDGGLATAATTGGARALAVDGSGNIYFVTPNTIREVIASTGIIQTLTGHGEQWDPQFAGAAADAAFSAPVGLATDANGNVYFGTDPDEIREVKMQSALTLSPAVLNFAVQTLGTPSAAQTVTLTNSGGSALTLGGITLGGASAGDYSQTNSCGTSLAAGAQCTISVSFTPAASGDRSANLEISDNAAVGTATVSLDGSGAVANAQLSATTLDLGQVKAATTSGAQPITLTNAGGAPLVITSVGTVGNFGETNNCGASLAAGATCTIEVTFAPGAAVNYSGQLTINFASGSQSVALSGEGVEFDLQEQAGEGAKTVAAGATAAYGLDMPLHGSLSGKLSVTCSFAPATTTLGCSSSPASGTQVTLAGWPGSLEVDLGTQARSLLAPNPAGKPGDWGWPLAAVILLLPAGALALRRRRWLPAMGLGAALLLAGCGGGGGSAPPPPPPPAVTGTPAGTYTATVTVAIGPVTHTVPLTLVVQ